MTSDSPDSREIATDPLKALMVAKSRSRHHKRRLFHIYFFLLHVTLVLLIFNPYLVIRAKNFVLKTPQYQPEYQGMVSAGAVLTKSMPAGAVLYLGDSRMRDLDVSTMTDGVSYNLSIGGDTTKGLRSRLQRYSRLEHCNSIILGVGVNDLSHFANEEIIHEYQTILDELQNIGCSRVIVCSILPLDEKIYVQANSAWFRGQRTTNARIAVCNSLLRELCSRHSFAKFADTTMELTDDFGNLRQGFTEDGLHLTETGNRAWAAAFKRAFTHPLNQ